jgi:ADP-ribosylation factor-like protein 2
MSCSAVTGENLTAGLDWVVGDVAGRLYYSSTSMAPAKLRDAVPSAFASSPQLAEVQ